MGADERAPWEQVIPGLAYRTALREWWAIAATASPAVFQETRAAVGEAEAAVPAEEAARIFDQERAYWWLTHEGVDPVTGQAVDDLNAHVGRLIAPPGVVPKKRPKEPDPAQGRLL